MYKTSWTSLKALARKESPETLTITLAALLVPGAALLGVFALLWLIAGDWREAIATGTMAGVAGCLAVALWGGVFTSGRTLGGSLGAANSGRGLTPDTPCGIYNILVKTAYRKNWANGLDKG
jgi:ACR3 family arsenite efflux pump ArsB